MTVGEIAYADTGCKYTARANNKAGGRFKFWDHINGFYTKAPGIEWGYVYQVCPCQMIDSVGNFIAYEIPVAISVCAACEPALDNAVAIAVISG